MATISFGNYNINEMSYKENKNLNMDETDQFNVENDFSAKVAFTNEKAYIILDCDIGDESETCPFQINIKMKAYFDLEFDNESQKDYDEIKRLLSINAIAILYPYIRSIVTDLTSRANTFEPFIMPVINIAKHMNDNNKIEFLDID
ncbi:preprotein translocase subunit SecB [Staphylococcus succinus]|nr:preprotein translocase subunit SecB [Staphylococcus succinus]